MQDFFEQNIDFLNKKSPKNGLLIKNACLENRYEVFASKSGVPTLSVICDDGTIKTLHSQYDPIKEATKFVDKSIPKNYSNFVLIGLGLGYHLHELIKKVSKNSRIIVIEKNPSLARLAFTYNDFSSSINHPGVSFHIGISPRKLENILSPDRSALAIHGYIPINFKPLFENEISYNKKIENELSQIHQKYKIDINTQAAFSKIFYKNIFDNFLTIVNSQGIKSLKSIFNQIPGIVVSAGPSLDKNISLIKASRDKIVVISVATALKPLLKNGVAPDFVVAVDPSEETLQSFNFEEIPDNSWLVYDPCIPSYITSLFKDRSIVVDSNVVLSKWISKKNYSKGSLGNILSVAHSSFYLARHIGCDPIILVGQDLSFDGHRMHCSDSFYNQTNQDMISNVNTIKSIDLNKYKNYSPSFSKTVNIFNRISNTTKAMESYWYLFKNEVMNSPEILNATEGGVTIPGTQNISLREALHNNNQQGEKPNINIITNQTKQEPINKGLKTSIMNQKRIFENIYSTLKIIQNKYLPDIKALTKKKQFVAEMDLFYKKFLKDPETLHLIQGYDYLQFIEWNQKNQRIINLDHGSSKNDILDQKFARDRVFLKALIEATSYLSDNFKRLETL